MSTEDTSQNANRRRAKAAARMNARKVAAWGFLGEWLVNRDTNWLLSLLAELPEEDSQRLAELAVLTQQARFFRANRTMLLSIPNPAATTQVPMVFVTNMPGWLQLFQILRTLPGAQVELLMNTFVEELEKALKPEEKEGV